MEDSNGFRCLSFGAHRVKRGVRRPELSVRRGSGWHEILLAAVVALRRT